MPVQLRFETGLTGEDYVTREGWREARLTRCPLHAHGGCRFASHGTYERKRPAGTLIRRWYCPQAHCTFSLLPDHLAARFPGTLPEIERVVATVEAARSVEAAADALRPDAVTLPSALRWVRRRLVLVRPLLTGVVSLLPELLSGCAATLRTLRERVGRPQLLMWLREALGAHLNALSRPLGFDYRRRARRAGESGFQQYLGPDPPRRRR